LQKKTKRNLWQFLGFMAVIAIISAAVSGYFFRQHMNEVLQKYAFMIKSQALMLRERGAQLKDLSKDISSYAASESGEQQASSSQGKALREFAEELQKQGEGMERYAGKLIDDVEAQQPESDLATIADLQMFAQENLETIQKQRKKIDKLEMDSLKLRSRIQHLRLELDNCMQGQGSQMNGLYPQEDYPEYHPGSNQNNR
jgi:hypothetical protein